MSGKLIARIVQVVEYGRRPAYVSLVLSALLAGLTAIRFVVLVQVISPGEYGVLNLFTLLATLMPLVLSLGLTPQYQRIAHMEGAVHLNNLLRMSTLVVCGTLIPSFGIILWVTAPLSSGSEWLWAGVYSLAISAATALSTFYSQVMLGLNFRTLASLMMFLVNAGATAALLPALFLGEVSAVAILGWWAFFAAISASFSNYLVRSQRGQLHTNQRVVSMREGLASIPSQIGPWLLIFVIRYMIGINIDPEAIANYAIASTVVDMAFLVAVSILTYFTNKVMTGRQSPVRGLLFALPIFVVLAVTASLGVAWLLPRLGQEGYNLSMDTAAVLMGVGAVRLYISAWRSRALGQKKLHVTSVAYVLVIFASLLLFLVWPISSLTTYALVTLFGFIVVAGVQRLSVRLT